MIPRSWPFLFAVTWTLASAFAALGCGRSFRDAHLTQPVSMSPMKDATLGVEAGRVFVTDDVTTYGMGEDSMIAVEIGLTNGGREPYRLSAASISCWMELSAEQPAETLSLTPAGGGDGAFPGGSVLDDLKLGSTTIAPGQSGRYWVVFRGYRYPGSDVPRKVTISLPDARGRRVQLVIADPARGQLRWEMPAVRAGVTYGVQNTMLLADGLRAMAIGAQISRVARTGPILWDVGLTARTLVEIQGRLTSPTSSFSGTGVTAHLTVPVAGWGAWQDPRLFGLYVGGEAQLLTSVERPPAAGEMMKQPSVYGGLSAEGGVEFAIGAVHNAATPFPISLTGPSLPRWAFRLGYTHLFAGGLNSGGYTTTIRFAW